MEDTVGRGRRGAVSQVYFPPRRRLIARQRRHVNDGNDGADEAKANGCIQRTKALLCSRHVIDGEWFTVSLPDAGEKRLPSNASGDDALGATRRIGKDALLTSLARLSPPIYAGLVSRGRRVIYVARERFVHGGWRGWITFSPPTSTACIKSPN